MIPRRSEREHGNQLTRAPSSPRLIDQWQPPDIAKVVIRPQQRNIIRHCESIILIIPLDLLVQAPHLRDIRDIGPVEDLPQDCALFIHNILQDLYCLDCWHIDRCVATTSL